MRLRYFKWPVIALGLLGSLLGNSSTARGQKGAKELKVADCIKLIRPDSVHIYFDSEFALMPPACAVIRRECRMDAATGNFRGQVRDYTQADNKLIDRISFANGLRNGRYEQYYENRQVAIRGQFTQGKRTGLWHFWYEDGKPLQTLQLAEGQDSCVRVVNYWNATGQQQVTDGEGTWRGTMENHRSWYEGAIVHGYQQGQWTSYSFKTDKPLVSEEYDKGNLKVGRQLGVPDAEPGQNQQDWTIIPGDYTTRPQLRMQLVDWSRQAEPLHLGMSCERIVRAAAFANGMKLIGHLGPDGETIRMDMVRFVNNQLEDSNGKLTILNARPQKETSTYEHDLLQLLVNNSALSQALPHAAGSEVQVVIEVDEQGHFRRMAAGTKELTELMKTLLPTLGAWNPASVNGRPIPGLVEIELRLRNNQWQSSMHTTTVYDDMAEVSKQFDKNLRLKGMPHK